ncbi:MAG: MMPL family transporter [Actinomycetota bacterium]|nr:MMPL family transporter [Actinomycetota bacterium]
MLERLAHLILRRKWTVLSIWLVLTAFGMFSAAKVSERWLEQFSVPGAPAFEANQRTLEAFGNGDQPPHVVVFQADGDVTEVEGLEATLASLTKQFDTFRVASTFTTGSDAYVSEDRTATFATFYPPGRASFTVENRLEELREAAKEAAPPGVTASVTGVEALYASTGETQQGPSVLIEALIGGTGALIILLFVFGTLPAVAMPLLMAFAAIMNTFTLVWILTYLTDVSIIVQFLVALVGLGVAIDYALLMIFRYREELRHGRDAETAFVEMMTHAGRSVIVSGSTVAIGLLSMVIIPVPVIRSIGIGGMLIPAVSVLASITLLPAMLAVLGTRINRVRLMPKRIVEGSDAETGFWWRWSRLVMRRPVLIGALGTAIVALLLIPGVQLNPADPQARALAGPSTEDAVVGLDALERTGITPGAVKPFVVVVEGDASQGDVEQVAAAVAGADGVSGASAPPDWRREGIALVEAFPSVDGSDRDVRGTIANLKDEVLPGVESTLGNGAQVTLAGVPSAERDFVNAVYSKFPYVLTFVILLTFILLTRAFRSVFLALKAVILNLVSLGAAFGIIVLIFQKGYGAEEIWNVSATDSITSWIPLMIFAFLYGLSMDYEVFMVSRIREAYDETGNTEQAVALGLARTGKLVTSAAAVLMFAFFVLSTGPGPDIKQFGIGLAAGVLFDATIIRAMLVPAIIRLAGDWNWWLPDWMARALFIKPREEVQPVYES